MSREKYWLWLTMIFGIGNERIWEVMRFYDDPAQAYIELVSETNRFHLSDKETANIKNVNLERCEELINWCKENKYGVISYSSLQYPPLLRHIYNPPAILYYDGDSSVFEHGRILSVVGARSASEKSIITAERLCHDLAVSGNTIASGFAVGIDITAHNAAIKAGRPTVAVLGCGIDVNYPKDNFSYRERLRKSGVFITEYPPGTSPYPQNFPKRNRILAGIASGVVVIEAGEKSGSLITAELALQNGREVFCLPPNDIYDSRFAGNIKFLRDGASAVYGYEDIRAYYRQFDISRLDLSEHTEDYAINGEEPSELPALSARENPFVAKTLNNSEGNSLNVISEEDMKSLSDECREIVILLKDGELHADIIADKLSMDAGELMMNLTELEIDGFIEAKAGNIYKIK